MSWFRRDPRRQMERELQSSRPKPRSEFIDGVVSRIAPPKSVRSARRLRTGVAIGATAALVGSTAAFGGYGVAASSATHAMKAVSHVVVHTKTEKRDSNRVTSAKHQYRRVKMCHDKHITIEVAFDDVPAHLAAGDTLGKCKKRDHERGD